MTDYLPEVYQQFERRFPAVKEAFDSLGATVPRVSKAMPTATNGSVAI